MLPLDHLRVIIPIRDEGPSLFESRTSQRVEATMASGTLREDHRHVGEALKCEVREYSEPQTVNGRVFSLVKMLTCRPN